MTCQARRYNNSMMCGACGLTWDVKDKDPPECNPQRPPRIEKRRVSPKKRITPDQWGDLKDSL